MNRETISHKRHWAWLAVAMSAPLAHFSGSSWLAVLVAGLICGCITALLPKHYESSQNRIWSLLQLLWIILLTSQLLSLSASYWPGPKSEWVVPAVLLAAAAYSCTKRPSRVTGVLFWVLIILYAPVLIAGVKDVQPRWLLPDSMNLDFWLIPILLLPCAAKWLNTQGEGKGRYFSIMSFAVVCCMITSGVLSPAVARQLQNPMRELSRSLTLGTASRFESAISVILTIGWFSLASLLLRIGGIHCESLNIRTKTAPWIIAAAAVAVSWTGVQLDGKFAMVLSLFLWVLVPILNLKKISKKTEKSP